MQVSADSLGKHADVLNDLCTEIHLLKMALPYSGGKDITRCDKTGITNDVTVIFAEILVQHHGTGAPAVYDVPAEGETQTSGTSHGKDRSSDQHAHIQRPTAARQGQSGLQHWAVSSVPLGRRACETCVPGAVSARSGTG